MVSCTLLGCFFTFVLSGSLRHFSFFAEKKAHDPKSLISFLQNLGGYINIHNKRQGHPPHQSRQFLGFSRFHFLQQPLCKVESELCTEKRIPIATTRGYAPQTVYKFWIRAVDNWVGWGNRGKKNEKVAVGPSSGYLHLIANALSIAIHP
jgi:hypothetical protein